MTRRDDIGDAGIRCIARGGSRALTHRAVDAEASLPPGSTSYYARSRRELLRLVTGRISAQLDADLDALALPAEGDPAVVAATFLDTIAERHAAQVARYLLLVELRDDDELRSTLTAADAVRQRLDAVGIALLRTVGVSDPEQRAPELVALVDALLLQRIADAAPLDVRSVLAAYLRGITDAHSR